MARTPLRVSSPVVYPFSDGILIHGSFPDPEVTKIVSDNMPTGGFPLVMFDPPYGDIVEEDWDKNLPAEELAQSFCQWAIDLQTFSAVGGALYYWGGCGKPGYRPFFSFLAKVESVSRWRMANLITWKKVRAYGVQNNYLYTREECGYFVHGDPKKPRTFNIPLLDEKRGYAGYNEKYPAKSEFYRRSNVWTDITEKLRDKIHVAEKPLRLYQVPIEVHTEVGEIVFDPMAGSGVAAEAARSLGRRFVLIERDGASVQKIRERLASCV